MMNNDSMLHRSTIVKNNPREHLLCCCNACTYNIHTQAQNKNMNITSQHTLYSCTGLQQQKGMCRGCPILNPNTNCLKIVALSVCGCLYNLTMLTEKRNNVLSHQRGQL